MSTNNAKPSSILTKHDNLNFLLLQNTKTTSGSDTNTLDYAIVSIGDVNDHDDPCDFALITRKLLFVAVVSHTVDDYCIKRFRRVVDREGLVYKRGKQEFCIDVTESSQWTIKDCTNSSKNLTSDEEQANFLNHYNKTNTCKDGPYYDLLGIARALVSRKEK